jgi:hypothetical protein
MRSDLSEKQKRDFLGGLIPLYRRRGTPKNMEELLALFTSGLPTVDENFVPAGHDTVPAHFFLVIVRFKRFPPAELKRQIAIAHALIELEKPAHTAYVLRAESPTMQIGRTSHVGRDTLIGTEQTTDNAFRISNSQDAPHG